MELILTEEEKAALSWMDLDDAALGKFTKYIGQKFKAVCDKQSDEIKKVTLASATMILVSAAHECNAGEVTLDLDGHTYQGVLTGDWQVIIRKKEFVWNEDDGC